MSSTSIYRFLGPKRFYHFIFWAIAIISHMVDHIGVIDKAGVLPYLGLVLERNGLLMTIVYFNFYILIPKLYPVNKIVYSLILIACMMLFAVMHGQYRSGCLIRTTSVLMKTGASYRTICCQTF